MTAEKNLTRFYRISTWFILILLACNILVKATIWFSSPQKYNEGEKNIHAIYFFKDPIYFWNYRYRYTTELKQKLFNQVDFLLTPAFFMLFVLIAVKLIKRPEIFQEKK